MPYPLSAKRSNGADDVIPRVKQLSDVKYVLFGDLC